MKQKIALLYLLIASFAGINASNSEAKLPLFFLISSTTLGIQNYMAINNLQEKQRNIIRQCEISNENEPNNATQELNLVKAKYKDNINLYFPRCYEDLRVSSNILDHTIRTLRSSIFLTFTSWTGVFLNLIASIYDRLTILQTQRRWDQGCEQAETISLQTITQFHDNNDAAIRNRQSLATNNVLIQKENELIDAINATVFNGSGINYSMSTNEVVFNQKVFNHSPINQLVVFNQKGFDRSTLNQLNDWRLIGKTQQERDEAERIKTRIHTQQIIVESHIEKRSQEIKLSHERAKDCINWQLIRNEYRKEKLRNLIYLKRISITNLPDTVNPYIPSEINQSILSEWLPSTKNETTIVFPKVKKALENDVNTSVLEALKTVRALGKDQN